MFCTSCGTRNGTDSRYCKQCGVRLENTTPIKIDPDDFERALPEDEHLSALLERAYQRRKEGDIDGAISLCQEALQLPTESTSAHSLLGQLYDEQGDRDAAIREYEQVVALNPGSIADRVKLDQLRHTTGTSPTSSTRVHFSHERENRVFDLSRIIAVSLPIVLVLLGGVITLLILQRNGFNGNGNTSGQSNSSRSASDNTAKNSTENSSGTQGDAKSSAFNAANATGQKPAPVAVTNGNRTGQGGALSPAPSAVKPIYIQVPVPTAFNPTASNANERSANLRPQFNNSGNGGNTVKPDDDRNHVRLPDTDQGDSRLTVTVDAKDLRGGNESTAGQKIEVAKPNSGRPTSPAVSGEARFLIASGQDKKLQKDYRGAIDAFTRALPTAGDQTGYILQQRASCFQNMGDNSSARADFTAAIEEYRKLEPTDPEAARNGIKVCERGIKTLGSDNTVKASSGRSPE